MCVWLELSAGSSCYTRTDENLELWPLRLNPSKRKTNLECVKTARINLITLVDKTFHYLSNLITFFNVHIIYERQSGEPDWLHVLCIR